MTTPFTHIYKVSPSGEHLFYAWFSAMHTRIDIVFHGMVDEENYIGTTKEIQQLLEELEHVGNYFDAASELSLINRMAATKPIPVSDHLFKLIQLSKEFNEQTMGYFDISINSSDYKQGLLHSVILSEDEKTVFFEKENIVLDLSGLLKGYALDCVREVLVKGQVSDALINMGNSSVLALGNQPYGDGWKIDFQQGSEHTIILHNECLTTSGNNTNERKHIISPFTHSYVEGKREIAVVTESGALGEALSTGLFVANDAQRMSMLEHLPIHAIYEQ
ncbi:MAG: FAD:protein FMN transferase [Phocaeicola sp.]|nr:FAD:protein FMN transferase [Phocaeicola sp.]